MKRFPILGVLLLIPAFALVAMVGCTPGKKDDPAKGGGPVAKDGADVKPKEAAGKGDDIMTATTGTVKGVVSFDGTPPAPKELAAIKEHKEGADCLKGSPTDNQDQTWVVSKDGMVANVVIALAPPAGKKFKVADELKEPFKKEVVVDQPFCAYRPHVIALYSEIQPIAFTNTFTHNHNVKIDAGPKVGVFDEIVPPKGKSKELKFAKGEKDYNAVCSIHGFMNAKICVFNHPYFAVTNDKGEFEIKNVPIDTPLTVYMWHESMGSLDKKAEKKTVTLKSGADEVLKLTIK